MRHIIAVLLVSFFCVFSQPVFAHKGKKTVAEIEKEQIEQRIRYLYVQTGRLENKVRKENKHNHAQSVKRVDREYLSKLKNAASRGDVELWDRIYMDYMDKRTKALANDKQAYEQKEAQKRKNPWYNAPILNQ